jgi:SAM-dependent methyltransferase
MTENIEMSIGLNKLAEYKKSQHELGKRLVVANKRTQKRGKYHGGPGLQKRHMLITQWVSKHCKKNEPLLEVGSCEGYLFDHLRDAGFTDLYGIDISPDAIEKLKKRGYKGEVFDIHMLSFSEKYGTMISSHSLEHCHNPKLAVENMYKALKKGGRLLVVVPIQKKKSVPDQWGHWYHFESFKELLGFFPTDKWKLIWDRRPKPQLIVEKI